MTGSFVSPCSFWLPERTSVGSGWAQHAPFAFWLADVYRPKVFVELGTHKGYSFAAFCQAIDRLKVGTQCHAIDTWQGDEHAGHYGNEVYDELKAYVDSRYSGFTHMIRATFDEALSHFKDGSIDLLHIDGRHFFEDVSHDFRTWIPKLTPNAVVLFHDTNVRERGFGVYELWAELAKQYPHFEFLHGNGLGVLGVGGEFPPAIRALFDAADTADENMVRDVYSRLGAAASDHFELVAAGSEVATLEARIKKGAEREAKARMVIDELSHRVDAAERGLLAIQSSPGWRIFSLMHRLVMRFPLAARILRSVLRLGWRMLKLIHRTILGASVTDPSNNRILPLKKVSAGSIRIPEAAAPMVSIVISTYGQVDLTLSCLASIVKTRPRYAIEVLVVDDAFPDAAESSRLNAVQGIRLSRNPSNLGFLLSCNRAAREAKGKYLYFLNNDTELRAGAIDALVELLEGRSDVGMVGSKLIFPNGLLQEAGGIVWRDASAWNYGRGRDPALPEFNYVREVDYCSGASIMVRRDLFESLGGFDEAFVPAYYEDVDLAFRIRERGMKVMLEPRSVVVHYEGMSHGTDLQQGVKAHQVVNQALMVKRWGAVLKRENYLNAERVIRAKDRASTRKFILVLDHYVPQPDRDAGSRSVMGIIDSLLGAGWLVKFWPHNRYYDEKYTPLLEQRGIEVLDNRSSGDFLSWMQQNGNELDHVLVIRPDVATYAIPGLLGTTSAVLSFYGVDLHFARMRRQAVLDGDAQGLAAADKMELLERRVWRNFDVVIYPSEEEAAVVRELSPGTAACGIVPFFFDAQLARVSPPSSRTILFVAGFTHAPNVDAAKFLVEKIVPLLVQKIRSLKVILAGSNPTAEVKALASQHVEVTGYISDAALGALYETCRVAVAPLRFGAGVKGKVIEALSSGLPIVTTTIGAQGISGLADIVPVHDDVAGFADALERLLTDDAGWIAQSARQVTFAQEFYSRDSMARSVLSALDRGKQGALGCLTAGGE